MSDKRVRVKFVAACSGPGFSSAPRTIAHYTQDVGAICTNIGVTTPGSDSGTVIK